MKYLRTYESWHTGVSKSEDEILTLVNDVICDITDDGLEVRANIYDKKTHKDLAISIYNSDINLDNSFGYRYIRKMTDGTMNRLVHVLEEEGIKFERQVVNPQDRVVLSWIFNLPMPH